MNFNEHSELEGLHAFLGGSNYHWINYDEEKLYNSYSNYLAAMKGTQLHEFAKTCILMNQCLEDVPKTLNMYVNDAIGFKMRPEQMLYYSEYCFGCADAISFKHNFLRIHDLKTGKGPTHMEQLEIYAAIFCLEYDVEVTDIDIELRIYQNNEIRVHKPDITEIVPIIDKIVTNDRLIKEWETGYHE